MNIYFDIFSGISGNMILGALIDLGVDFEKLKAELGKLDLRDEYNIKIKKVNKKGIQATYLEVELIKDKHHKHEHHHHGRSLSKINKIIEQSSLSDKVKKRSKEIFFNLAQAEAKIHGKDIDEIHFHEVGAVDAIVDIVGSVICLELLGIEKVYASRINTGTGFVKCDHGMMPVPAPATLELLKNIPLYSTGINKELVTPTGSAIISTVAESFGPREEMKIAKTGYGAGWYDLEIPNVLRVNLFQKNIKNNHKKKIKLIETNIDDMNPEFYEYIMEKLFKAGALDVFYTPIHMKKSRPAVKLSVLTEMVNKDQIIDIILTETTSLGVRIYDNIERECLERQIKEVETPWGMVNIKLGIKEGNVVNIAPEYESCKRIAEKTGLKIKEIYDSAKNCWYKKQ